VEHESIFQNPGPKHLVPDDRFAAAYDRLDPRHRALIKKQVAQLYACLDRCPQSNSKLKINYDQGFSRISAIRPLAWTVILVDPGYLSPSGLTACCLPPLLAGVEDTAVICTGGDWPDHLLTALELSGHEAVYCMSADEAADVVRGAVKTGRSGAVLHLGSQGEGLTSGLRAAPGQKFWRDPGPLKAGVWAYDAPWDYKALAFSHPDTRFDVWHPSQDVLLEGSGFRQGGFVEFLANDYDVLYVPAEHMDLAVETARWVFAPGQECMWSWPELDLSFFTFASLAFGPRGRPDA